MENIKELVEFLIKCDDAYFNGQDNLIEDSQYDSLKHKLKTLDPTNPYFNIVGSDVRGGKIKLPYKMGSLNQIYDQKELDNWAEKYHMKENELVISDKLDGCSAMVVYNNGELQIAYSRGDGLNGADITRHVKHLGNLKLKLTEDCNIVVRGEVIMKNDTFSQKYSNDYSNPRSMVAGCMNRKTTEETILADIDFIAYEIVHIDNFNQDYTHNKINSLILLEQLGFQTARYSVVKGSEITDSVLKAKVSHAKSSSEYELDGIVVTINDYASVESVSKSSSINPEHSFKYKALDTNNVKTATVTKVNWEISKSGFLKPVVQINPINLFGTVVTYTTGFNAKFIKDNMIGPGAMIKITKSGSVIPYILEVIKPAQSSDLPGQYEFGKWEFNSTGVEAILIDHEKNSEVIFKQVLHFFETLKIDQLKSASLRKLYDTYELDNSAYKYEDVLITLLNMIQREFEAAVGANGAKIFDSLEYRKNNMPVEMFIGGLKFFGFGFGTRKAKALMAHFKCIENLRNCSISDLNQIDGFDQITSTNVYSGLDKFFAFYDSIKSDIIFLDKVVESSNLTGISVCMTGFRDADLQEKIEANGGKVVSGVSKKTTHLLAADKNSNSTKLKKARDLGITIMEPEEFRNYFSLF